MGLVFRILGPAPLRAEVFINSNSVATTFHIYEPKTRAKYNKTPVITQSITGLYEAYGSGLVMSTVKAG